MAKPESTADTDSVILIDGSSYVYRAYHALPPLTTSSGQPTGAVRGVTTMVMRILEDHPNSPIGMIFDAKGDTFRHEMYKEYKANRPPMPDDLRPQIQPIYDIVEALGVKIFVVDNVEADDVIAHITTLSHYDGWQKVIVSNDKDFYQLCDDETVVFRPVSKTVYNKKRIVEELGVHPRNMALARALVGDASDNLPGIKGVGLKTVAKNFEFLSEAKQYDLDELIDVCRDQEKPKVSHTNIMAGRDIIAENYDMMQLYNPTISYTNKKSIEELEGVIFGVSNLKELLEIIKIWNSIDLNELQYTNHEIWSWPNINDIDPRKWNM